MNAQLQPASFIPPEVAELAGLFPAYEIAHLIATGGMGAVYCATQKSLDRTVAIKILPRELTADEAFREGFVTEAKAMARLNHPNLIGVYDFGEVAGMLYIIMEFVPGQSLHHSAYGLAIDPLETIRLVSSICLGLAHAHENGLVHRDIKPANILLDLNAQPKIGDFGLARPYDMMVNEGDEIYGTPHYTAPEVVNPPYVACYRADIYSVGVMLHELLTGRPPTADPQPASSIVHCDARFDAIIRRATKPDPEHRYANATEMANDLIALAGRNVLTPAWLPPPDINPAPDPACYAAAQARCAPQPSSKRSARTPSESSGVATFLIVLLAVGLGIFGFKQYRKYSQQRIESEKQTAGETSTETPPAPVTEAVPNPQDVAPIPQPEPPPPPVANSLPEPVPTPQPAFDSATFVFPEASTKANTELDAFYERARKVMKTRAAPVVAENARRKAAILADYQSQVKGLLRKVKDKKIRSQLDAVLEDFMRNCRDNHNTLPENPDSLIATQISIDSCHLQACQMQKKHDDALEESLGQMSALYIVGLEKQMDRLKAAKDPAAALVQQEIDATRSSKSYFADLILK